jgi:hypothetical protein
MESHPSPIGGLGLFLRSGHECDVKIAEEYGAKIAEAKQETLVAL